MEFYEREVKECDLQELSKRLSPKKPSSGKKVRVIDSVFEEILQEKQEQDTNNLKPKREQFFELKLEPETKLIQETLKDSNNPDIIETFIGYLRKGSSMIRIRTYLNKINNFLEKNLGKTYELQDKYKFKDIDELLTEEGEEYLKKIVSLNRGKHDLGDMVKTIKKVAITEYAKNRDKIFPFGNIGMILDINEYNKDVKVFFKNKTDHLICPDKIFPSANSDNYCKDRLKQILEEYDPNKNIGKYNLSELKFVPPSTTQITRFNASIEILLRKLAPRRYIR